MSRLFVVVALLALAACAQQPPPPPPVAANPPPPPPAPPAPTTYSVYFDYNSSQLGPEAREIVRFAADGYKAGNPGSVRVAGYTDASGSAGYNQRLSQRRANAIAAELQRDGVPQGIIIVGGRARAAMRPIPGRTGASISPWGDRFRQPRHPEHPVLPGGQICPSDPAGRCRRYCR